MSTAAPKPVEARIEALHVTDTAIVATLNDGRTISVPVWWSWRLEQASPAERKNFQIVDGGYGVHWPDVDEDISVDGMLNGTPAPRPTMRR